MRVDKPGRGNSLVFTIVIVLFPARLEGRDKVRIGPDSCQSMGLFGESWGSLRTRRKLQRDHHVLFFSESRAAPP